MRLIPRSPRVTWLVLGCDFLSAVGSGLTMPFFVVYLHRVRGIDLTIATLALATIAFVSFGGNVAAGSLSDRIGPRRTVMVGLCFGTAGACWFAFVHSVPAAFGAAALIGSGASISWPALDSLLASTVDETGLSSVFALRHGTMNAGFGLGALIAVGIVDFGSPRSFQLLYLVDASSFLVVAVLLSFLRGVGDAVVLDDAPSGGYREVLRDRTFVWVWALTAMFVIVGYAQLDAAVPAYVTDSGSLPAHALGYVFAANTFAVAVAQLFVLRGLRGRRRTTAMIAASLSFACSWLLVVAAGHVAGEAAAIATLALGMVVLALAETLLSPALSPIVNALAPDRLRGRYNGVFVLAYTTGFLVGPALAGGGLRIGDGTTYFVLLAGAAAVLAPGCFLLRGRLPRRIDLVDDEEPEGSVLQPEPV